MFPVSSIGNDISSDLVRRKMNDLPESPIVNNLEALAPGIEKLKQTSIQMVTLLNALQPGGKCIITGDFQKELAYLQNVILYNDSSLRMDFFGYNALIIQRSDNTCELTINEPLKNQEISTGKGTISLPVLLAIWSVSAVTSLPGLAVSPILGDLNTIFPSASDLEIQMLTSLPSLLIIPFVLLSGKLSVGRDKLRNDGSLRGYLLRAVYRTALNVLRSKNYASSYRSGKTANETITRGLFFRGVE